MIWLELFAIAIALCGIGIELHGIREELAARNLLERYRNGKEFPD